MSLLAGFHQEGRHRHSIEVKHLGTGELSVTNSIKAQHLSVKPIPRSADSSLSPKDDNLVFASSDNARIQLALSCGRLQRLPRLAPSSTIAPVLVQRKAR